MHVHQYLKVIALSPALALVASCAVSSPTAESQNATTQASPESEVTVLTHDSFALPDELIEDFENESGIKVEFTPVGDAGSLVNSIALSAGSPLGDAVYGIDNTFASRAVSSGALQSFVAESSVESYGESLTAIDYSDVCFNVDLARFGTDLEEPTNLESITDSQYAGMVAVPNPTTSSPGLALLLASYVEFGDGWEDYWRALRDNGLKVGAGWSDVYFVDFSAPNYGGDYPIVLSYASSPPSEVIDGVATTAALLDTCFRQVEYAGILEGAENPDGAAQVIEWLLSDAVQSALPESMYVYPISPKASIPSDWAEFAPLSTQPITMDPAQIDAMRDTLLRRWDEIVVGGA